ncbi:MAG: TetR/AcrR family transcriptional regulator [Actinobacteria bacterium]|nr:TetR/AcrR family transcriptional regulator [Actinomycetota bacterium]
MSKKTAQKPKQPAEGNGRAPNGARKELIIDAATEIFSSRPYEEINLDEICERAGVVSHGLIAYHFNGKRGLYVEVLRRIWAEFLDFQRPRPDEVTMEAQLRGLLRRHYEYIEADPQRWRNLLLPRRTDQEVFEIAEEARSAAVRQILDILELADEQPPRLRAALHGINGYNHELTLDWISHKDLDVEEIAELSFNTLVQNLRDGGEGRDEVMRAVAALENGG